MKYFLFKCWKDRFLSSIPCNLSLLSLSLSHVCLMYYFYSESLSLLLWTLHVWHFSHLLFAALPFMLVKILFKNICISMQLNLFKSSTRKKWLVLMLCQYSLHLQLLLQLWREKGEPTIQINMSCVWIVKTMCLAPSSAAVGKA